MSAGGGGAHGEGEMGAWTCRKWGSYHTGILGKRAADRGSSENKGPEAAVRQTVRNSRAARGPGEGCAGTAI